MLTGRTDDDDTCHGLVPRKALTAEALESVKGDLEAASKAVGALTVAASDDAEATEASIESFELGEAPAKRKKD